MPMHKGDVGDKVDSGRENSSSRVVEKIVENIVENTNRV